MTGHEYLEEVLRAQAVPPASVTDMQNQRDSIEQCLRNAYGWGPKVYYAGSYGKDTMINAAYDLDIVIYFAPGTAMTLKDIYWGVFSTLQNGRYIVQQKDVAIRLPYNAGYHIDVVPGRYIDQDAVYANLYRSKADTSLKTSIKVHIDTIKNSGLRGTIKLVKLWSVQHNLGVRSFALELLTIRALKGQDLRGYDSKLAAVLRFLRDNIQTIRFEDPANSNNVISDLIPYDMKVAIAAQAQASIDAAYWSQVVW